MTLAAAFYDLKRLLRAHVGNVDGGERIIGDDLERCSGRGARKRASREEGG